MKGNFHILLLLLIGVLNNCQEEQTVKQRSPEEVLQIYQGHFDQNEFDKAILYSTSAGKDWIESIAPMISGEFGEETTSHTIFHSIDCKIVSDTAICDCLLEDETETYEASYRLIKVKDIWLVDAPDEDHSIEYEDREEIFDDLF